MLTVTQIFNLISSEKTNTITHAKLISTVNDALSIELNGLFKNYLNVAMKDDKETKGTEAALIKAFSELQITAEKGKAAESFYGQTGKLKSIISGMNVKDGITDEFKKYNNELLKHLDIKFGDIEKVKKPKIVKFTNCSTNDLKLDEKSFSYVLLRFIESMFEFGNDDLKKQLYGLFIGVCLINHDKCNF